MKFTELEIHQDLIKAATDAGFDELTPIQAKCLEPGLKGLDIAGVSQTGTGKTVAFLLPILHKILTEEQEGPSALIVTPTRELCIQIKEEAEKLTRTKPIKITAVYGGEGYGRQEDELSRNPDLIVATPGRLIDYLKQDKVKLSQIRQLVLDEADRMFDMGFIRDIRFIMKKAPENCQTMLFSATLSYYVMRLASDFMKDPVRVEIESESVAVDRIAQSLLHLGRSEKLPYLINLILQSPESRAIVFTNTRFMVQRIQDNLRKYGIPATGLSSLLDQKKRIRLLKDFKLGRYSVLVATDVASRGIDIDDISHVYNFDVPQDGESYVHRIGRTARAGKTGFSVTFCSEDDYENLPRVHRYLNDKIPVADVDANLVGYPKGEFKPFREPKEEKTHTRSGEQESGSGHDQDHDHEKKRRSRKRRKPQRQNEPRKVEKVMSEVIESDSSASSVRASDRAAILSGINTRAGGAKPAEPLSQEAARNNRKKGPRNPNQRGKGKGGSGRREDGTRQGRRARESHDRHHGGKARDERRQTTDRKSAPVAKKGIVAKIISFFKK